MFAVLSNFTGGQDWWPVVSALLLAGLVAVGLFRRSRLARSPARRTPLAGADLDSEQALRQQNLRLDAALNNMTQGLCMFGSDERIVVFNRRFLEMHQLSPQVVKPGCTFRELIQHRWEVGLLGTDPETYYRAILDDIRQGKSTTILIKTTQGRVIQAFTQPMPGGGWVTTHADVTEQRHAEDQVRDQKLLMDAALTNIGQGLLLFDADARLLFCNRPYMALYDLTPDQVKPGTPLRTMLQFRKAKGTFSRDPDAYEQELKTSLRQGVPVTLTPELPDGRIISVANYPMKDGRWVSTHEDITEQRRAEKQLREQKLQLDTALNNMSQGLNMFDAAGRLVVHNKRYLEMYRLSPDIVKPGCSIEDLVQARVDNGTFFAIDAAKYTAELQETMARREPTASTMELADGRTVAVSSQPTPDGTGWVVTHEDVTERRHAEQERDRSQAFADTVIENVPVTIVVKDAQDLRYRLINRAGEQHFGVPRTSMIGKSAAEVFSKEVARQIAEHDENLLETGKPQRPRRSPP